MKFADVCALMPEGVYWGDGLTPEIARELVEAGNAHAAAVSADLAAENARLREALEVVLNYTETHSKAHIAARAALKGASHE